LAQATFLTCLCRQRGPCLQNPLSTSLFSPLIFENDDSLLSFEFEKHLEIDTPFRPINTQQNDQNDVDIEQQQAPGEICKFF